MAKSSLDWSDTDDWRRPYFGLPARAPLPAGYRSYAMRQLDDEEQQREVAEEAEAAGACAHICGLVEADEVARWADVVQKYGANVVEAVMKHADLRFELPVRLRPQPKAQTLPFEEE